MSRAASLLGAEPFLKKRAFRNSGTPVRRTRRRKSPKMDFQEFWDSCAQNKTSEISKRDLSRITGLLSAEKNVGNLKQNALSRTLGLPCAEQTVGNLKKMSFRNSGTPVRRTKRRKSQNMHFREPWDSCAQNKPSEVSKK